jgi:Family of unknown function (DUF6270)
MSYRPSNEVATRILIFGSSVSRDALGYETLKHASHQLVDYYGRCSLAALGSSIPATELSDFVNRISSEFQSRMVMRDIQKEFFNHLPSIKFDVLLIDLIEERFDIWVSSNGGALTLSSELVQTGFLNASGTSGVTVPSGSEEFFQMWERGWAKLLESAAEQQALHKIRINRVLWRRRTAGGGTFPYSDERIDAANALLNRMYKRILQDLPSWQFLCVDEAEMLAADTHRWGLSPFHFVPAYYLALIRQLEANGTVSTMRMTDLDSTLTPRIEFNDPAALRKPVFSHPSVAAAVASGMAEDGIHRVALSSLQALDTCTERLTTLRDLGQPRVGKRWLLVSFGGAVTAGPGRVGPFFAGLGIARDLGLPVLCVSDPTLALDSSLGLAWYAGNADVLDLPDRIAALLSGLAETHGVRLLLFGGSGGGFVSLAVAARLRCEATVFVWNPQTTLSSYVPGAVRDFLRVGFPSLRNLLEGFDELPATKKSTVLRSTLDQAGVLHDVVGEHLGEHVELLYLQNQSDWHLTKHAQPYLDTGNYLAVGNAAFTDPVSRRSVYFGDWGKGHEAPDRELTRFVLRQLVDGVSPPEVASALDRGIEGICEPSRPFFWIAAAEAGKFYVAAQRRGEEIAVDAWFERDISKFGDSIQYAFYLLLNDDRIETKWYSPEPATMFEWPKSSSGVVRVMAFFRDRVGSTFSAVTDVLM